MNETAMALGDRDFRQLIDGHLIQGAPALNVIDPATEEIVGKAPVASLADFEAATSAAKRAFPLWRQQSWRERSQLLMRLADILESNASDLATILTFEQGRPFQQARLEVQMAAGFVRTVAALTLPTTLIADDTDRLVLMEHDPLGIVAAITPWNGPIALAAVKLANALLAGNCVLLKPSPFTPLATLWLGRLIKDLFPPGVLNILSGDAELGGWMTSDPGIAKVTFTGSTPTGMKIAAAAASTLKRLTLELGGNDAAIVLGDVDVAATASAIAARAFANAGQFCAGIKRLYIDRSIFPTFCDALTAEVRAIRVGGGFEPDVDMGPVQNRPQLERVTDLLDDALRTGRALVGGRRLDRCGYFLSPAIVIDVAEGVRLVDEEQFGPVLPVMSFATEEEALTRANASRFGLGGSIWSRDIERAMALAKRLEVGTSWVNQHGILHAGIPLPFAKESGLGIDYGAVGLAEFTQAHVINVRRT